VLPDQITNNKSSSRAPFSQVNKAYRLKALVKAATVLIDNVDDIVHGAVRKITSSEQTDIKGIDVTSLLFGVIKRLFHNVATCLSMRKAHFMRQASSCTLDFSSINALLPSPLFLSYSLHAPLLKVLHIVIERLKISQSTLEDMLLMHSTLTVTITRSLEEYEKALFRTCLCFILFDPAWMSVVDDKEAEADGGGSCVRADVEIYKKLRALSWSPLFLFSLIAAQQ